MTSVSEYLSEADRAFSDQSSERSRWAEIQAYQRPGTMAFGTGEQSKVKPDKIFDSTAEHAQQNLVEVVSGMFGNIGPAFFQLHYEKREVGELLETTEDKGFQSRVLATEKIEQFDDLEGVQRTGPDENIVSLLKTSQKYCEKVIRSPETSWVTAFSEAFGELIAYGNAAIHIELSPQNYPTFQCLPLSSLAWSEGNKGIVDSIYRQFRMTNRQAYQRWGAKSGESVVTAMKKSGAEDKEKLVEFYHIVKPDLKNVGNYLTLYINKDDEKLCEQTSFDYRTIIIGRWSKQAGQIYGRGLGEMVQADVKALNELTKLHRQNTEMALGGPVILPESLYNLFSKPLPEVMQDSPNVLLPVPDHQARIYRGGGMVSKLMDSPQPLRDFVTIRKDLIESIERGYKRDIVNLARSPEMTAIHFQALENESMRQLQPSLARIRQELLLPIIKVILKDGARNGRLNNDQIQINASFDWRVIGVKFSSEADQAVATNQANRVLDGVSKLMSLTNYEPALAKSFDFVGLASYISDSYGIPSQFIIPAEKVMEDKELSEQQRQTSSIIKDQIQPGADALSKIPNQGPMSLNEQIGAGDSDIARILSDAPI